MSASVEHIVRNFKKESGISERMFTEKLDFNVQITQKNCRSKKIIGDSVMNQITNGLDVWLKVCTMVDKEKLYQEIKR